jgi:hypothetical protein
MGVLNFTNLFSNYLNGAQQAVHHVGCQKQNPNQIESILER